MSSYREFVRSIYYEINNLRVNPKLFSERLQSEFKNYKSNNVRHRPGTIPMQTREGLRAVEEAYEELLYCEPLPLFEWSEGLSSAAVSHCNDTGPLGIVGHIGSRETSLQQRIEKHGSFKGTVIEALDYGSLTAFEVVISLLVDDGLITRPHRKTLLNPNYTRIGIGSGPHSEFKIMSCIIFSEQYTEDQIMDLEVLSTESVPTNPEIDHWLDGAVKLTVETREEIERGEKVRKIKKHWTLADGTIETTEDTEKIEFEEEPVRKPLISSRHEEHPVSSGPSNIEIKETITTTTHESVHPDDHSTTHESVLHDEHQTAQEKVVLNVAGVGNVDLDLVNK